MYMVKQRGAALVVGLVILMVVTMIGISSMSATTSQLKMSNNLQTQQIAFQATEAVSSYFEDGSKIDANPYFINWNYPGVQTMSGLNPSGDGKSSTELNVVYVDCITVPMKQGLTGDSQSGEGGGFRGLVHNLEYRSSALNSSGDAVGQKNNRLDGVQTIAPGCP